LTPLALADRVVAVLSRPQIDGQRLSGRPDAGRRHTSSGFAVPPRGLGLGYQSAELRVDMARRACRRQAPLGRDPTRSLLNLPRDQVGPASRGSRARRRGLLRSWMPPRRSPVAVAAASARDQLVARWAAIEGVAAICGTSRSSGVVSVRGNDLTRSARVFNGVPCVARVCRLAPQLSRRRASRASYDSTKRRVGTSNWPERGDSHLAPRTHRTE
jgi:hypothetical protein